MPATTRISIAVAVAGIAINAGWNGARAQNPIADSRGVRAALAACWIAPAGAPRQISVRLGFNPDGEVLGQPLVTYENPQPPEEGRAAVRDALAQALGHCTPLHLSDEFRKVISVRPITVRLGDGWPRRKHPASNSEQQAAPGK